MKTGFPNDFQSNLTLERLREALRYDSRTGNFHWLVNPKNGNKIGDIAGRPNRCGHWQIMIDGKRYYAHRLAWLYVYEKWPEVQLDHINLIPGDNRIDNLRYADRHQNGQNRRKQRDNKSGYKGVCWHKATQKWIAQIRINRVSKHLGIFSDPRLAYAAYCEAAKKYHGEFARAE